MVTIKKPQKNTEPKKKEPSQPNTKPNTEPKLKEHELNPMHKSIKVNLESDEDEDDNIPLSLILKTPQTL